MDRGFNNLVSPEKIGSAYQQVHEQKGGQILIYWMIHLLTKDTDIGASFITANTTQLLKSVEECPPFVVDDALVNFLNPKEDFFNDEDLLQNSTWIKGHQAKGTNTENQVLELVSLLTSCAESIKSGDHAAIDYFISRLGEMATPRGSSIHRIVAYFTGSLSLRAVKLWPHVFSISHLRIIDQIDDDDNSIALRLLNQVSPIPKFLYFTLNERLLRAFEGHDRVHIIDFDIKEGLQWPSFLLSLASRPNPPTHVRITGIGDSRQDLQNTGARLKGLAESLNLQCEFHPVVDSLEDVRLWMLHVKEGECVAVNCLLLLHKVLYDENRGALINLLGLIRSTKTSILLVGEEEAEHNDPRWEVRFANSLKYYSAIFDSIHSSHLPEDNMARIKIEEMFAQRIRNILVWEGRERVERHETLDTWREMMMEFGGFRCLGFGERGETQCQMLLKMYSFGENFSIERRGERSDGLTLKWMDQSLYTVSAWTPITLGIGSSATTQID